MAKTVVIAGALDTKGADFAYLKELIEREGVNTLVVDFGVMGEPAFPPDITRAEVAKAGGGDIAYLATGEHKDEAMRIMAEGLAVVVRRLYDEGKLDGIISMGVVVAPPLPQQPCVHCPLESPRSWSPRSEVEMSRPMPARKILPSCPQL